MQLPDDILDLTSPILSLELRHPVHVVSQITQVGQWRAWSYIARQEANHGPRLLVGSNETFEPWYSDSISKPSNLDPL